MGFLAAAERIQPTTPESLLDRACSLRLEQHGGRCGLDTPFFSQTCRRRICRGGAWSRLQEICGLEPTFESSSVRRDGTPFKSRRFSIHPEY